MFSEGGQEPINFSSAPDACALGARAMAEYVLLEGRQAGPQGQASVTR